LWDKAYRERISLITKDHNTARTVPADARAVAVSCDDQKLVLLTVKAPVMVIGKHKYIMQWTDIFVDQAGHLTTGREYQKYELGFRSNAELPLTMVTLREHDVNIALVAFSDGHIERAILG
jgi:hypothetical protein